jgi:hypothetical protein
MQEITYFVGTGRVIFRVEALSPQIAIAVLKHTIHMRRFTHYDPDIGMSLVEALDAGQLDFVVMNEDRSLVIAGELQGRYEEPASYFLVNQLQAVIPLPAIRASQLTY